MPLALVVASCIAIVCVAATPTSIPGQQPQIGNGFVAAFVNASSAYTAGVFSANFTNSTRAGVPNAGRVFVACPNTSAFAVNETAGSVSLRGACAFDGDDAAVTWEQRWYAVRDLKWFLATELYFTSRLNRSVHVPLVDLYDPNVTAESHPHVTHVETETLANATATDVFRTRVPEYAGVPLKYVAIARTSVPAAVEVPALWNHGRPPVHPGTLCDGTASGNPCPSPALLRTLAAHVVGENQSAVTDLLDVTVALAVTLGDHVYCNHVAAWADLWAHAVEIDSPTAAPPLRASQYAIMSALRADTPYSTSPGGLATDGYRGHSFWDEATWVLPNLMLFHPDIAAGGGLQYRFDRLAGARINARETLGISGGGAAFPWESAVTGRDVCPAPLFAHTEIHITADVANAVALHYRLTGDRAFLQSAWATLNATALFWVHRTTALATADGSPVHLDNVTGPDEYHLGDDSGFTNYAVQLAVAWTIEACAILHDGTPCDETQLPALAAMQRIATHMHIPYNATAQYHPEYDEYAGQAVKQADTILLNYPLGLPMSDAVTRNDLVYYGNRTSPNKSGASTMTWTMFSIGWLSLGDVAAGLRHFALGFVNNCFAPYWQWYQEMGGQHGNDNFISGAGGFVQNFWAGFGAVRVTPLGVELRPANVALPADGTHMRLRGVRLHGTAFTLSYRVAASTISVTAALDGANGTNALCYFTDGSNSDRAGWGVASLNETTLSPLTTVAVTLGTNTDHPTNVAGVVVCPDQPTLAPGSGRTTPVPEVTGTPAPAAMDNSAKWVIIVLAVIAGICIAVGGAVWYARRRRAAVGYSEVINAAQ